MIDQPLEEAYRLQDAGEIEDALRAADLSIQHRPDQAEAWNLKGLLLEQLGRGEEAYAAYEHAVGLDPDFGDAQENLAGLAAELLDLSDLGVRRTRAAGIAWRSGLVFAILFSLAGGIGGFVQFSEVGRLLVLTVNALLQGAAGGLSVAWLGILLGERDRARGYFWNGFLGFGAGYFAAHLIGLPNISSADLMAAYLLATFRNVLILAFAGWMIARVFRNRRSSLILMTFGAISALYLGILTILSLNLLAGLLLADFNILETGAAQQLGWVHGATVGALGGIFFGAGFAWFAALNQPAPRQFPGDTTRHL